MEAWPRRCLCVAVVGVKVNTINLIALLPAFSGAPSDPCAFAID